MPFLLVLILIPLVLPAPVLAETTVQTEIVVPDKGPCTVCTFGGAGHGEEEVAGYSRVDGELFLFCSKSCKERFDEDPAGYRTPEYPMPAPSFTATTLDGEPVTLGDYHGRWLLLDFWATWCKPCLKLMPEFERLMGAYGPRGLNILGVSVDTELKKVHKFAKKKQVGYPLALDDTDAPAWNTYAVKVVPTVYLIDPEGQIRARWVGVWDYETVSSTLDELLP